MEQGARSSPVGFPYHKRVDQMIVQPLLTWAVLWFHYSIPEPNIPSPFTHHDIYSQWKETASRWFEKNCPLPTPSQHHQIHWQPDGVRAGGKPSYKELNLPSDKSLNQGILVSLQLLITLLVLFPLSTCTAGDRLFSAKSCWLSVVLRDHVGAGQSWAMRRYCLTSLLQSTSAIKEPQNKHHQHEHTHKHWRMKREGRLQTISW